MALLEIPLETYIRARNALIAKDLIAFDGTRFQVLSLPYKPRFDNPAPMTTDDDESTYNATRRSAAASRGVERTLVKQLRTCHLRWVGVLAFSFIDPIFFRYLSGRDLHATLQNGAVNFL